MAKSIIGEIKTLAEVLGVSPLDIQYTSKAGQVTRIASVNDADNPITLVLAFNVPRGFCLLVTELELDSALLDGPTAQEDRRQRVMHSPEDNLFWSYAAPSPIGPGPGPSFSSVRDSLVSSTDDSFLNFSTPATGTSFILFDGGKDVRLWITRGADHVSVGMRLNVTASGYLLPSEAQEKLSKIALTL